MLPCTNPADLHASLAAGGSAHLTFWSGSWWSCFRIRWRPNIPRCRCHRRLPDGTGAPWDKNDETLDDLKISVENLGKVMMVLSWSQTGQTQNFGSRPINSYLTPRQIAAEENPAAAVLHSVCDTQNWYFENGSKIVGKAAKCYKIYYNIVAVWFWSKLELRKDSAYYFSLIYKVLVLSWSWCSPVFIMSWSREGVVLTTTLVLRSHTENFRT